MNWNNVFNVNTIAICGVVILGVVSKLTVASASGDPIVLAAVSGLVGFIAGDAVGKANRATENTKPVP